MSATPKSYGWSGDHGERTAEPIYTPDLASEIDSDGEEPETDFYVASELLREIFTFCFAFRGNKPQPNLQKAFRRFACVVWLTRPELLGDIPLMELGPELGCTRANLSKMIRDFGDRWGGLRNRLQTPEGARRIYAEAQLKDHWRNRAKKKPAAPRGTADCLADEHSNNGTVHSEGST